MHIKTRNVNTAFRLLVRMFKEGKTIQEPIWEYIEQTGDYKFRGLAERQVIVSKPSRNGRVLMIDEPVTITFTHPRERVLFNAARDANPFFHLFESLWMLAGRNDIEPLTHYVKRYADFSDDGKTANGAYGYRWRKYGQYSMTTGIDSVSQTGVDQLDVLVNHLKAFPDSRRAVLQMWNVEDDLLKIGGGCTCGADRTGPSAEAHDKGCPAKQTPSRDVCCNLSVMFSLRAEKIPHDWDAEKLRRKIDQEYEASGLARQDRDYKDSERRLALIQDYRAGYQGSKTFLDMTVTNRSNDVIWGTLGANVVHFSFLQEYMACRLGAEVGLYHHFSNNQHVYDDPGNPKVQPWTPDKWLAEPDRPYPEFPGTNAVRPSLRLVQNPEVFDAEVKSMVGNGYGKGIESAIGNRGWTEPFLNSVAAPIILAYDAFKRGRVGKALEWCTVISADDWRIACEEWLKRRNKPKEAA